MGQKHSQPEANITKINFNPDTEVISKTYDPHYGDIKVVRDSKSKETFVLKELVLNTTEAFEKEQNFFTNRVNVKHPNIVNVIGYNSQDKHNFCSTYYKLSLFIEHLEDNLQTELETRKTNNNHFSEEELNLIADDLITGLSYFQSQGFSHGDIRPFNIFHKNQVYKLSDPSLNAQRNANALTLAIVQNEKTLLAPELAAQVPESNYEIKTDPYKADVFSLGATLLSLATLTNSEDLYNYEKGTVNQDLISERLAKVKENYSEFTHDLIEDLLIFQEAERPDSVIIANKINPHKDFMRRGYQGAPLSYANSRINLDEKEIVVQREGGERVLRANLPTDDYRGDSIAELEARIRAAILRTEETFKIVRATPGLSGVFDSIDVKPANTEFLVQEGDRLVRSQVGNEVNYNFTLGGNEERAVKASVPVEAQESNVQNVGLTQKESNVTSTYIYETVTKNVSDNVDETINKALGEFKSGAEQAGYTTTTYTTYTVKESGQVSSGDAQNNAIQSLVNNFVDAVTKEQEGSASAENQQITA